MEVSRSLGASMFTETYGRIADPHREEPAFRQRPSTSTLAVAIPTTPPWARSTPTRPTWSGRSPTGSCSAAAIRAPSGRQTCRSCSAPATNGFSQHRRAVGHGAQHRRPLRCRRRGAQGCRRQCSLGSRPLPRAGCARFGHRQLPGGQHSGADAGRRQPEPPSRTHQHLYGRLRESRLSSTIRCSVTYSASADYYNIEINGAVRRYRSVH